MSNTRVLIADMPGILNGLVRHALHDQHDLQVVGELAPGAELEQAIAETRADVVVVVTDGPLPAWPSVGVVALQADATRAWTIKPLVDLDLMALADAVRTAATAP